MSGICGVRGYGVRTVNATDLAPMVRALAPSAQESGSARSAVLVSGPVGLAAGAFPGHTGGVAQVKVHGRSFGAALYGSVYNWAEVVGPGAGDPVAALLRVYAEQAMAFVQRLRGEFVLAVWNEAADTLQVATDRFRVHPLVYCANGHSVLFASRIAAIRAHPWCPHLCIDPDAVMDVLARSTIPTPRTIFHEIKKLPPGSVLTCRKGDVTVEPYWDLSFLEESSRSFRDLARDARRLVREAVTIRVAPGDEERVGAFLSGGVDSSTVTGVLTQVVGRSVKTFSIGFDESRFNELDYARIAARAFGAEHHEYVVTADDAYRAIPILLGAFDEPYANASAIPTYYCARLARQHGIETLFAGDGGDELFAGNERYADQRFFDDYFRIPAIVRESLLAPLVFHAADATGRRLFVKGKKYIQRARIPYPDRLTSYGFFSVVRKTELLAPDFLAALGGDERAPGTVRAHYFQAPARTELDRQLYIDLKLAIVDNDLLKVTRMTEAAGVSVRFPLLDHELAEFSATVPAALKMRGRRLRVFFKDAFADLLPRATRAKKKHGFGLPIGVWLRTHPVLNELMHDLVLSPRSVQRGYFQRGAIVKLVARLATDETSFYGTALWNLMMLELWHRERL